MLKSNIKRFADIVISSILIVIFSPLLLLVALLIYISDGKEIFLNQPLRLGVGGREFKMYKFRSMILDAHKQINENPKFKQLKKKWIEQDGKLKLSEDLRVTWIGRIIRKTDIDELPQLFNVLKGEMSLVGPRPMYQQEVDRYIKRVQKGKEYLKQVLTVRPGITGIWQVSGRNDISFEKRVILDYEYSKSVSLTRDLKILFLTPYIVLTRKGAYE